jgi:signal transduction histidine kinase
VILHSALDRVVRTLVVSIGIGSVLFTLLGVPGILQQHAFLNPVYSIVAIVLFCGLPPAMAILSVRVSTTTLRILAGIHAAATLGLVALWYPSMTQQDALVGGDLPWIIGTITVAAVEAALAVPFVLAWVYVTVLSVACGVVRFITYGSPDASQAIQDTIMILLISGFLMSLVQLTLLAGREQDAAALSAQQLAATTASEQKLERQRNRYRGLTRDDVAATLRAAMKNTPDYREFARRRAITTLESMGKLSTDLHLSVALSISDLDNQLRATAVAHDISYASSLAYSDTATDIPVEVADALVEAATEAMRNSNQHSGNRDGRVVHQTIRAQLVGRGIEVVIRDDGRGFNPRRVGIDRLGIRLNIVQRMEELPGGSARIESAPGRGTVVTLDWNGDRREQ